MELAQRTRKDPRLTELILQESKRIVRVEEERGVIITETKHGFICANAGIDSSNIPGRDLVATLPLDSNRSAALIQSRIVKRHKLKKFGVIIYLQTWLLCLRLKDSIWGQLLLWRH